IRDFHVTGVQTCALPIFTVDELADRFGIGRRTLERRFKKATNNTVIEYIQRVKIEASKKELETSRKTVNEVMYEVGYTDTKAFKIGRASCRERRKMTGEE